jgi:alpha-maltose-1-phosphate synthase
MEQGPISVTLTQATDPYQRRLPRALLQRGMLRRVLRVGPDLEVLDPVQAGALEVVGRFPLYGVANRLLWGAWRRLPGTGCSHLPMAGSCWMADQWASRHLPASRIFHGLTGVSLASLKQAKKQGSLTILESPMVHLQYWQEQVMTECNYFGVRQRDCGAILPAPMIRRAEGGYDRCDRIQVLSSAARRSFELMGYAHKAVVILPGIDHHFYRPPYAPRASRPFRACFVGRGELAKGLGDLLEAWKRLALPNAELLLIGEMLPEMNTLLKKYPGRDIRFEGKLPPDVVARRYRESNILVFPSVNEGLALVLLEAMASALPVVATSASGAEDCITEGKDGFVVPDRNVDALAEKILWCYRHPDELAAMGRAARAKIEQQFTLSHYEERQIALYQAGW